MQAKVLRIVVSSPSDVNVERDAVDAAVANLNPRLRGANVPYQFVVSRWERDAIPGMHPSGPQGRIDEALMIPDCDFLVCIFWKRFGTPVPGAGSGTEHEMRQAIAAWKKRQSPQLLLYFNNLPFTPATTEEEAQYQRLKAFEQELLSSVNPPLIRRYPGPDQFHYVLVRDLLASALKLHHADDTHHLAPLRFAVTAQPARVRAEGYSELVGDIFVKCTYAADAPSSHVPLWTSFVAFFNTLVTSRLSGLPDMNVVSETILIEVGRPGVSKVNYGVVSGNTVSFDRVELTGMQPGETRTFRITNIRCNATLGAHPISASVVVAGRVEVFFAEVGIPTPALSFAARSEEPKRPEHPTNADGTLFVYTPLVLTFKEEFANAFKTKTSTSSMLFGGGANVVSLAESSVEGPHLRIPGSSFITGMADCATRFGVRFHLPYLGVRLFVSAHNIHPSPDNLRAEGVRAGAGLIDTSKRLTLEGMEMCEVSIKDHVACAEWELIERGSLKSVTLEFAAALAFEEHSREPSAEFGYLVYGELAPTRPPAAEMAAFLDGSLGWGMASSTFPIPRFTGSAAAVSLKITVPWSRVHG